MRQIAPPFCDAPYLKLNGRRAAAAAQVRWRRCVVSGRGETVDRVLNDRYIGPYYEFGSNK